MTETKAPLPESVTDSEIDTMMSDIGSLHRAPFQVDRGLRIAKKLRAHIEAQAAEIETIRKAAGDLSDTQVKLNGELQAEIERLRGAMQEALGAGTAAGNILAKALAPKSNASCDPSQPAGGGEHE